MGTRVRRIKRRDPEEVAQKLGVSVDVFLHESDRGMSIYAAELLSYDLEQLIRAFFRQDGAASDVLLKGVGPISTFSARIQLSYLLRIVTGEERRALELIRRIRNESRTRRRQSVSSRRRSATGS